MVVVESKRLTCHGDLRTSDLDQREPATILKRRQTNLIEKLRKG
jgi:hypothetical protein